MRIVSGWDESRNGKLCADELLLDEVEVLVTAELEEVEELELEEAVELAEDELDVVVDVDDVFAVVLVDEATLEVDKDDTESELEEREELKELKELEEVIVVLLLVELPVPALGEKEKATTTPTTNTKPMRAATTALLAACLREPKRARE
jgi:hypothetical protein